MAVDWLRKQFRFGGAISVPVNDAATPTTATDAQAAHRLIALTGALTSDRTFILPLEAGADWIVSNATTGGYDVSVGGATGTRVDVPAGQLRYLVSTGTKFQQAGTFDPASPGNIGGTDPGAGTFNTVVALNDIVLGDDPGNRTQRGYFTATTTDATTTQIGTISLPSTNWDGVATVEAEVIGRGPNAGDAAVWSLRYAFAVEGGLFGQLGTEAVTANDGNHGGMTAPSFVSEGTDPNDELGIYVTGLISETWKWRVTWKVTFNSLA